MPTGTRPAPPDDTVRLIHSGTIMGHRWNAVQWLAVTATSRTVSDLNAVLAVIGASWHTHTASFGNSSYVWSGLEGIWKTPGGGEIIGTYGTSFSGSSSSALVDNAASCFVVNHHISAYYRGGHPRLYFPAVFQSEVSNGSDVSGAQQSAVQAAFLAILNDTNAATSGGITGVTLGTVSFQHANAWRTPPIFRGFTGISVRPKLGTQRRRITS